MTVLDSLESQLTAVQEQAAAYLEREDFDPDDLGYKALKDEGAKLERSMREQSEWTARKSSADEASAIVRRAQIRSDLATNADRDSGQSAGELFTRSGEFGAYMGYGTSGRVEVGDALTRAVSLPIKTTDLATGLLPGSIYNAQAPLQTPALDLIPTVVTNLSSFPVWGVTVTDGGAAVVAEGDAKPALDLEETQVDVSLDMVAVYTQFTRQALEDVAMIRAIVDTELRREVLRKFEGLAITAITGANLPTAQAPHSGGSLQGAIRLGVAKVQSAGWTPTAVAVNPDDAANIDIDMLDKAGACCADGYWGLRIVPVPGLTAGTAIVGDFGNGARTYARQAGVSVFITDSHADTFLHNVFTILAETRRKTVITRADAFAKVSVASS